MAVINATYEQIAGWIDDGSIQEHCALNDAINVSYGSYTMTFEVTGFEPILCQVDEEEVTRPALNLLFQYTTENTSAWGNSGSTKYSASALRAFITSATQDKLDPEFIRHLAFTKVQTYSRDGTTDVVYDRLFAPSMAQLGVTDTSYNNASQAAVEGPAFAAYQGSDNAKRLKQAINATGTAQNYWTRSLFSGGSNYFGCVQTSGAPYGSSYGSTSRVVVACNFIGNKSEPDPATDVDNILVPYNSTAKKPSKILVPYNALAKSAIKCYASKDGEAKLVFEKNTGGGYDPENPTLEGLKAAVDAGDYEAFPVGTKIADVWDDESNPLIVSQYLDSTNNEAYGGAEGVICVREYVSPTAPFTFGDTTNYDSSSVKEYLDTVYLDKCSSSLKNVISEIKVPWWNGSSMLSLASKFFLMGVGEVCGDYTSEGIIWDYWKQVTGFSTPSTAANEGRTPRSSSGAVQYVWLRSRSSSSYVRAIAYNGSIISAVPSNTSVGILPACFIAKSNSGGGDIFDPVDPDNVDLDNLSNIVKAGKASEYLNLGDELSIAYDTTIMPMRVVGFADATVRQNGADVTIPAIQMEMKDCAAGTTKWSSSNGVSYSASALKSYIEEQIQPKFSDDFLACLGETKVQFCTTKNDADVSYNKLFAPSMAELGVTDTTYNTAQQNSIEGPVFQYYEGTNDTKRIKQAIDATGTAQNYWTRSLYGGTGYSFGRIYIKGSPNFDSYYQSRYTAAVCNFIGKY